MEVLAIAGGAALLTGDVVKYNTSEGRIKTEESQNRLQASQAALAFSQKTLTNISNTQKVIGQAEVAASAQGEAMSSPSIQALQFGAFQKGKEKDHNLSLEEATAKASFDSKAEALSQQKSALPWQAFGDVAKSAMTIAAVA
jgi:hypothetical protein